MKLIEAKKIERIISYDISHKETIKHLKSKLPQKMISFCKKGKGVGLAAPQIGLFQRFFIARLEDIWKVCFNPVILRSSEDKISSIEGCLSYPQFSVSVERPKEVWTQFNDGKHLVVFKLTGVDAVVFQHELDHLDGITINTLLYDGKAKPGV